MVRLLGCNSQSTDLVRFSCRPLSKWYIRSHVTCDTHPEPLLHRHGLRYLWSLWSAYLSHHSYCPVSSLHWYVQWTQFITEGHLTREHFTLGSGEAFNVGRFLEESSPYAWGATGIGLCLGFSVLGAGWCVFVRFIFWFQVLTSRKLYVGVSS